jgi:hypothetical protein
VTLNLMVDNRKRNAVGRTLANRNAAIGIGLRPVRLGDSPPFFRVYKIGILPAGQRIATWVRFLSSQQSSQPIRGFVGRSILSGLDEDGWMLLNLGQVMHAGSGCAAGLGRIEVY